jgi:hypothetical protein
MMSSAMRAAGGREAGSRSMTAQTTVRGVTREPAPIRLSTLKPPSMLIAF